jgi:hypothetical protein
MLVRRDAALPGSGSSKKWPATRVLARDSNTGKSTTRNAIARAVAIGLLERTERRYYCAVSLPNILSPGKLCQRMLTSESTCAADLSEREWPACDAVMEH